MIEVETEKMLCVKCPITDEWQMLKDCAGCSNSDQMLSGEGDKFLCSRDESEKQKVEDYIIRNMDEDTLAHYLEFKRNLEELTIADTTFHFVPEEVELTDDVIDYMEELAHMTRETDYTIYVDSSQGLVFY